MTDEARLAISTLAAGMISARGDGSVAAAQTAVEDAENILFPRPTAASYKGWQGRNGLVPSTALEDEARSRARAEGQRRLSARLNRDL